MINKDTEIYCSFAREAGNVGCKLFNSAFNYYGLNKIYKSFSIEHIEYAVDAVRTLGIKGFAITMPFKIDVLEYIDKSDKETFQIGAANTVINDGGTLTAYNTDYFAAKTLLDKCLGVDLYILGDGGYSKAVQQAAKSLSYNYTLIEREQWGDIKDIKNSIIYNCTPVENIEHDNSNDFIDCIVKTKTGKELSWLQASRQFNLYTGKELPIRNI